MKKKDYILFYFPFAGGTSYSVSTWNKIISEDILFIPLDIPGRGKRLDEKYPSKYSDVVDDFFNIVKQYIENDNIEYIILGHSLGGYLTYHVCDLIERHNLKRPKCVILSAAVAINRINELPLTKRLKDNPNRISALENYIISVHGIPELVRNNKKLLSILTNTLLEDLHLIDTMNCDAFKVITSIPAILFYGLNDELDYKIISEWKNYFHIIEEKAFEGNHFFILENYEEIITYIQKIFAE